LHCNAAESSPRRDSIVGADEHGQKPAAPRAGTGESVTVENDTPPGQSHQPSSFRVFDKLYQAPLPALDLFRKMRPGEQAPGEMWSDIGPWVLSGNQIWFASTFYNGEGISGVGAVGAFNLRARRYRMHYPPEIAAWSGSAMLLNADNLWIGLVRHPEGADYGGGLLRYNTKTGAVTKYAISDVVHTIDRVGDGLYCGTSHGLYVVRGDQVTQSRFEPDAAGKFIMVEHAVRWRD